MINERRVHRIKKGIYGFLIFLFFLPLVLVIILGAVLLGKIGRLSAQLEQTAPPSGFQEYGAEELPDPVTPVLAGLPAAQTEEQKEEDPSHEASGDTLPEAGGNPSQELFEPNTYVPAQYETLYFDKLPCPSVQDPNVLYLSFDNTPSNQTDAILKVLDEYNVRATFFVWDADKKDSAAYYKTIVEAGHSIGIHSYSSSVPYSKLYASLDSYLEDFEAVFSKIYEETGVKTRLYRLPGGSVHKGNSARQLLLGQIKQELDARGFLQYDWTVSAEDAYSAALDKEEILQNLALDAEDGTIVVLLHDSTAGSSTVEALEEFIASSLAQGYEFRALDYDTVPVSFID